MKIFEFNEWYKDEQSCRKAFKEKREKEGITCIKCGNKTHYWKKNREEWECKKCHHRTTLRSGTVMQSSKLPFRYWFVAMHLLTSTKKSFSAKEIQRQLGHKRYQPIWEMLHKIRCVMGLRDAEYNLASEVELDEGFFETVTPDRNKEKPIKRGRGSQKQTTVLVSAESLPVEDEKLSGKYKNDKKLGFVKMKVIDSLKKDAMTVAVKKQIEEGTIINTDGSNSYNGLKNAFEHRPQVSDKKNRAKMLPWVHTAISNAKKLLLDVHHRIDDDFLQCYLDEFCYKLNRRYFDDIFDRLLVAAVSHRWNYLGELSG